MRAVSAQHHLSAARDDLTQARTALTDQRLPDLARHVTAAGAETQRARALTSDPVWVAAAHVPFAGRSFRAAGEVARVSDRVARGVLPEAVTAARTLDPKRLRAPDGSIDVAALQSAAPRVTRASQQANQALRTWRRPKVGVLPQVRDADTTLRTQLTALADSLDAGRDALALAPALLGADRPRRYFVMVQQSGESRGTGGLPGGFSIVEAANGRVRVTAQGSDADLRNGELPPPPGTPADFIERYSEYGVFELWQNVNLSPDLPQVARLVAQRWQHQSGQQIDGVVALDAQALADILRGSEALTLPSGRKLPPDQIVDYLAVGQYREFVGSGTAVDRSIERKAQLVAIARAAAARLAAGGDPASLLRGLADAVTSGHLRMASDDPALAPGLVSAGVTGAMPAGTGPVAYPVLFNATASKLDSFVDRSIMYSAASCSGQRRQAEISVTLVNRAPLTGLPPYLTINTDAVTGQSTTDGVTLEVFGSIDATLREATLNGRLLPEGVVAVEKEAGRPVWFTNLNLKPGQPQTLTLKLDEPTAKGAARVPEQPLARPLKKTVHVPTC